MRLRFLRECVFARVFVRMLAHTRTQACVQAHDCKAHCHARILRLTRVQTLSAATSRIEHGTPAHRLSWTRPDWSARFCSSSTCRHIVLYVWPLTTPPSATPPRQLPLRHGRWRMLPRWRARTHARRWRLRLWCHCCRCSWPRHPATPSARACMLASASMARLFRAADGWGQKRHKRQRVGVRDSMRSPEGTRG